MGVVDRRSPLGDRHHSMNHGEIVSFLWSVADLVRDTFKRGKYQDVILPLTVLRRLDCVLAPTKPQVLAVHARYQGKIENLDGQLRRASGFAFYNTSLYDFEKLLADPPQIAQNLRNYVAGFSPNMHEVLEKFDFDDTICGERRGLLRPRGATARVRRWCSPGGRPYR